MSVTVNLITGFMVGIEFFSADELLNGGMFLDLGIARIIFERVL